VKRILAIRLPLAYPLRANLRGIPDPHSNTQTAILRAAVQTSERARWLPSRGHGRSLCPDIAIKLLRFEALRCPADAVLSHQNSDQSRGERRRRMFEARGTC